MTTLYQSFNEVKLTLLLLAGLHSHRFLLALKSHQFQTTYHPAFQVSINHPQLSKILRAHCPTTFLHIKNVSRRVFWLWQTPSGPPVTPYQLHDGGDAPSDAASNLRGPEQPQRTQWLPFTAIPRLILQPEHLVDPNMRECKRPLTAENLTTLELTLEAFKLSRILGDIPTAAQFPPRYGLAGEETNTLCSTQSAVRSSISASDIVNGPGEHIPLQSRAEAASGENPSPCEIIKAKIDGSCTTHGAVNKH